MDVNRKDEDSATKHVLDYYKKYSQNKELPKYFSGTSLSYLPEMKEIDSPETEIKTLVKTDINIIVTAEDTSEDRKDNEQADTSRASSAMSNRKLEWDNGADIGYSNYQEKQLRRSLSLPLLTDELQKKSDNTSGTTSSNIVTTHSQSSSSEGNVKVILLSCSSSTDCQSDEKKHISSSSSSKVDIVPKNTVISTSSSDSSNKQSIKQFASTLSYLKQKIGLPDAHSTPKGVEIQPIGSDNCPSTPSLKKSSTSSEGHRLNSSGSIESSVGKKLSRKSNSMSITSSSTVNKVITHNKSVLKDKKHKERSIKYKYNKKIVNLAVTKPITVECTCSKQSLMHRSLQTKCKQSSVAVQTERINDTDLKPTVQKFEKVYNNQSLMYFEYSESSKTNTCSTQTNSEIASNCDSFEYMKKASPPVKNNLDKKAEEYTEVKSNVLVETDIINQEPKSETTLTKLKRTQKAYDLKTNTSEESSNPSLPNDCCLENVVSSGLVDKVEDDINNKIYLLQRLLKSKKYDSVTKKRHIKKIIKNISEAKYFEESSTSSDLFVPKKVIKRVQATNSSGDKNNLHSSVPWYPIIGEHVKLSPKRKKLVQKTFTQDFIPGQHSSKEEISSVPEIVPINARDTRKNRFTLTNGEFVGDFKYPGSIKKIKSKENASETDSTSLKQHYESSSTSKSYENWKEDKTLSERILEKQSGGTGGSNGHGDCIVKFADKERQFQISWINNEISHLGKLKGLLEKKKPNSKLENMTDIKKTTNVYTVSNENDSKLKHNYVIETLLGTRSSSEMNFQIDGQVYTVEETTISKKRDTKRQRQVIGNIEVVSSDSTTNIKVTTFCNECKKSLCICNEQEYETTDTCNFNGMEKCGSHNCIHKAKSLDVAPAPVLETCTRENLECICTDSSSGASDYLPYCMCNKHPCVCGTKINEVRKTTDSNTGLFIPINPVRNTVIKFSTYPSTSKEVSERQHNFMYSDACLGCGKFTCICDVRATKISKKVVSTRDQASSYGSLRKVFENCACTQTNCTCDFVEKLVNCFYKADVSRSTMCGSKPLQTENGEIQNIVKNQNRDQQASEVRIDDKCLQTETCIDQLESHTTGIQNSVESQNQKVQAVKVGVDNITQTDISKLDENFEHIGIQTKIDMKDQILQTTRSLEEKDNLKYDLNQKPQIKGVSLINNEKQKNANVFRQDSTASLTDYVIAPSVPSGKKSVAIDDQRKESTTTNNTSPKHVINQHNAASQTVTTKPYDSSDNSRPTSSKSYSSGGQIRTACICCSTQTASKHRGKHHNDKGKAGIDSSKGSSKGHERNITESLATSSTVYEICPSILVMSHNDTRQSASDKSSSKSTQMTCFCCNEKYPMDQVSILGSNNEMYPLCCACLAQRPILTSVCYAGPEENCPCSKPSYMTTFDISDDAKKTEKTVTDSNDVEEYCTCTKPFQLKNSNYCSHCRFKLKKTTRSKNSIAYMLTLENDCLNKVRRKLQRRPPLEEIRVKVPCPSSKKKYKDKENLSKRNDVKDNIIRCDCGNICRSNCRKSAASSSKKKRDNKTKSLTLQEYLRQNRPDFVESADTRRNIVLNSKDERESGQVDAKLKFAEENANKVATKKQRPLFTEREMKDITKRNYKKLPEVKQKLMSQREKRLRDADRLIVDVFARKIQRSVLKGKRTFPIDSNVMCLPNTCNC